MSRRPGIAFCAVKKLVKYHESKTGVIALQKNRDVQGVVRYGKRVRPLGRYIVRKTREALGVPHSDPERPNYIGALPTDARYHREELREVTKIRTDQPPRRGKL